MKKINHFIISLLTILCMASCSDDDYGFDFEGSDNYITSFGLTVNGVTYQADITGEKITVHIPYNVNLGGATATVSVSEGSSINPNPATIKEWNTEWKFIVTSHSGNSRVYNYTYNYGDISESNSVFLSTQSDVDNFTSLGINRINGNLTIGTENGDGITNLNGLKNLVSISNTLIINPSYKGADLTGLDNLESVGGLKIGSVLEMCNSTTLKKINLPALSEVVSDIIINCSSIESVALPRLESIGDEFFFASDALLDFDVNSLKSIGSSCNMNGTSSNNKFSTTEAIVFTSLTSIGKNLILKNFPEVQGIYLPELTTVGGNLKVESVSSGSIAISKLISAGAIDINTQYASVVELPNLVTSGSITIEGRRVTKLNLSSLQKLDGDMTLKNLIIDKLDVSMIDFNSHSLILQCNQLSDIIGAEVFNGSISLQPSRFSSEKLSIEGISIIKGDFEAKNLTSLKSFEMPFKEITGNLVLSLYKSSVPGLDLIRFSNLAKIGGDFTFTENRCVSEVYFDELVTVGGSCTVSTLLINSDINLPKLKTIGSNSESNAYFQIYFGNILCPVLEKVEGAFNIEAYTTSTMLSERISYPLLQSISEGLIISGRASNEKVKEINFPNLVQVKNISISKQLGVTDFSTFKPLFNNGILTNENQWKVANCGYNPTYEDMKAGKYKPAE